MEALDINLKPQIYDWYSAGKQYELRAARGKFSPEAVVQDRPVILHKGNTGVSSNGRIGNVVLGTLDEILEVVSPQSIAPPITSKQELKQGAVQTMGVHDQYVAFEIIFT